MLQMTVGYNLGYNIHSCKIRLSICLSVKLAISAWAVAYIAYYSLIYL